MDINIDNYLRIDVQDMIMVLISTFLIIIIVKKFFWNYLREYLKNREAFIQGQLDESAANLKASDELKLQYEEKLAGAKNEANEIISNASTNAKNEANEIVNAAKLQAEAIKEKAQAEIEHEKSKVRNEMKEQISEVAFMAAQKVVEKELDEEVHKKYVEDFIKEAGEEEWQA